MSTKITYQAIKKICPDDEILAERYYRVIVALNNIRLSDLEIELLVFLALNRSNVVRSLYMAKYGVSSATLSNRLKRLKKYGLIKLTNGWEIEIHPSLALDFEKDLVIKVELQHG